MTVKLVDNKQDKPNSLVDDKRVWFVLMGHQESLVDNKRVCLPWWNNFFVSLMLGTTEPDEKDIWIGWCGICFTNEASNEICIAISVRKILSFKCYKAYGTETNQLSYIWWQWQLTWKTNEAYNGICITRTVEMTALSLKRIYLLLTFAQLGKKNFCRVRKNWSDGLKQQKSTINFRGWLLILGYYDQEAVNCNAIANDCK